MNLFVLASAVLGSAEHATPKTWHASLQPCKKRPQAGKGQGDASHANEPSRRRVDQTNGSH